jgi:hypothetical protein
MENGWERNRTSNIYSSNVSLHFGRTKKSERKRDIKAMSVLVLLPLVI